MKPFAVAALIALLACSCSSTPSAGLAPPSAAAAAVQGRTWVMSEALDAKGARIGALLDKSGRPLALTFGPDEIAVLNACNHIGGRYRLHGEHRLRIDQVVSTLMACPESDLMEAERVIGEWLPKAQQLQLQDKRLELKAADGSRLVFVTR